MKTGGGDSDNAAVKAIDCHRTRSLVPSPITQLPAAVEAPAEHAAT